MRKSLIIGSLAATFVLAPAAAASAHTHVEVCDYEDGTPNITEIWFKSGKQLTNPTGNDANYGDSGFVVTNRPCPAGPAGSAGADGKNGKDGKDGKDGAPGAKGEAGAQGPKGDTGAAGSNGTNGSNGATGEAGADGAAGQDGATGPAGAVGPAGSDGPTGADGAVGANGSDGAVGAAGPAGEPGAAGLNGADGANGVDGKDGVTTIVKKIVHSDGTVEEVPVLPATGANRDILWGVAGIAVGLFGLGAAVTVYARRK